MSCQNICQEKSMLFVRVNKHKAVEVAVRGCGFWSLPFESGCNAKPIYETFLLLTSFQREIIFTTFRLILELLSLLVAFFLSLLFLICPSFLAFYSLSATLLPFFSYLLHIFVSCFFCICCSTVFLFSSFLPFFLSSLIYSLISFPLCHSFFPYFFLLSCCCYLFPYARHSYLHSFPSTSVDSMYFICVFMSLVVLSPCSLFSPISHMSHIASPHNNKTDNNIFSEFTVNISSCSYSLLALYSTVNLCVSVYMCACVFWL